MRIEFFAVKSDLLAVLGDLGTMRAVKYTVMNGYARPEVAEWVSGADIPNLGYADGAQASSCTSFLITGVDARVNLRRIVQYDKTARFDVDQLINPDSIVLNPGGEWKGHTIIAGRFATASNSPASRSLMGLARRTIKKHFTRVRAFWVGPEALTYLRSGKRLTIAEQSSPIYDLRE